MSVTTEPEKAVSSSMITDAETRAQRCAVLAFDFLEGRYVAGALAVRSR